MLQTEPPPSVRRCIGPCGLAQPLSSFARDGRGGHRSVCTSCMAAKYHASQARTCVQCGAPLPKGRQTSSYTTCSRPCLLESVGLPPTFDAVMDLDRAAEREIRDTLDAVILAVRGKAPR